MIKSMENMIGKIAITIDMGPRKRKITSKTRELQGNNKEAMHHFENIANDQTEKKWQLMEKYYETQKMHVEKEDQESIVNKVKYITRERSDKVQPLQENKAKYIGKAKGRI